VMTIWSCRKSSGPTYPCPRPAFSLIPSVDTVSVGGTRQFTVGPELAADHGRIRWSSAAPLIATVDPNGLASALSPGSVQVHAIDEGSPTTCPDQWYGTLVVR
jgi:hypothetical protein